jgi:hypothetical protein
MAKVVRNGDKDGYDIAYSSFEKMLAGVVTSLLVASVVSGIAMYREIGILSAQQRVDSGQIRVAVEDLKEHKDLPFHLGVYENFVTRAEFERALATLRK